MNNAILGFTIQKLICKKFNLAIPTRAIKTMNASYSEELEPQLLPIIDSIFSKYNLKPVECTTMSVGKDKNNIPYNFILSDNSTLSIRTNFTSGKIAPREVGQAGYSKLNHYFSSIYGKQIENQADIKELITTKIEKIIPIFIDFLFDADYIMWIYYDKKSGELKYELIKGNSLLDISFKKQNFAFTRGIGTWKESTTLKYEGKSFAEIQTHEKRTFKFRFIMKTLISLIREKEINNETLGITAEKTICDLFYLDYPLNVFNRSNETLQYEISDIIEDAFQYLPAPIKYTGNMPGERGKNSKCPYDFLLEGNLTLSLKTNYGKMVCPPEVGQPSDKTCYFYFKDLTTEDHIDKKIFKEMVFNNVDKMIPIYLDHLFDSDYLLRIYETRSSINGQPYDYEIRNKNTGKNFQWKKAKFSFSKTSIDEWNVSNMVYYDGTVLGEFEVHNSRNCFKFRFNFENLMKIIKL